MRVPFHSARVFVWRSIRLLWKRLPHIALYTVVFFVLFKAATYAYYHLLPTPYFVKYTSVIVTNAQEGEDVPFTVCRESRGNYTFKGFREILLIPEGQTEEQGVNVHTMEVENTVSANENCKNYYISKEDYSHRPGMYMLKANVEFNVGTSTKHTSFKSNIYTVFADTPEGLENQIRRLQRQVEDLQEQVDQLSQRLPRRTSFNTIEPEPRSNQPPSTQTPQTPPRSNPQPNPQPPTVRKRACDRLEKLLQAPGIRRICR